MPARIARHPVHPMLVPLPIGLFVFSFVCDVLSLWQGGNPAWPVVALYAIGGGVVGALLAAVFGLIDLLAIAQPRVRRIGMWHMTVNLTVVALFIASFLLRLDMPRVPPSAFVVSLLGIVLLVFSGWLGGEMVYVHGVGSAGDETAPAAGSTPSRTATRAPGAGTEATPRRETAQSSSRAT